MSGAPARSSQRRPALGVVGEPARRPLALGHPVREHEQRASAAQNDGGGDLDAGRTPTSAVNTNRVSDGHDRLDRRPQPERGPVGEEDGEEHADRGGEQEARLRAAGGRRPPGTTTTSRATDVGAAVEVSAVGRPKQVVCAKKSQLTSTTKPERDDRGDRQAEPATAVSRVRRQDHVTSGVA